MPKVSVFCPCSEPLDFTSQAVIDPAKLQLDSYPHTITDQNTHHLLSFLNFCEYCQSVKCRKCIEPEVVVKYCPKCLLEMKSEYSFCSRNCFDCPLCDGNVSIHQSKHDVRNFKMKCLQCDWQWETGELEKQRALSRVVKRQLNMKNPMQRFSILETFYLQRKQLLQGELEISKDTALQMSKLKLNDGDLKDIQSFIGRNSIKKFDRDEDLQNVEFLSKQESNSQILTYTQSIKSTIPQRSISSVPPNSTKLKTKISKRCKACRNSLMKPDKEITSVKFYKLSNAIDYLPLLKIHPHPNFKSSPTPSTQYKSLLSFENPLDIPMKLTISTYSITPGLHNHKVHIPNFEFELPGKPENYSTLQNFIKTIPTIELLKDTKLGRIEHMNRNPINFDYDVVEKGINWCVFPILIEVDDSNGIGYELEIPVFITVKTEFYSTGYWSVLKFGSVE